MTNLKASRHQGIEASRASRRTLEVSRHHALATSLRRAFSLVELVIVVGIIVLLVGLTLAVLTTLTRGSESRRTQDMLTLVEKAYEEWKTTSERDVSYGKPGEPQPASAYEILQEPITGVPTGSGNEHEATDELLEILYKHAPAKDQLANINSAMLKAANPPLHDHPKLIDAWETEVITLFPGRLWVSGFDPNSNKDADGTIRTEFETAFGVCVNRRTRFVSAGPDGMFGDLVNEDFNTDGQIDHLDNIYSYPLEAP